MRQKDIDFLVDAVTTVLHLAPEDEVAGIKMCAGQIAKSAKYANDNLNVEGLLALASDG